MIFEETKNAGNTGGNFHARRERLLKLITNPDSIVIIKPPAEVLREINRVNDVFRNIVWRLLAKKTEPGEIERIKTEGYMIAKDAWNVLGKVYIFANVNRIEDWRMFNDSYDQKKTLIEQNLRNRIFIAIPANDICGMLYTVLKHMCILRNRLRWEMDVKYAEVLLEAAEVLKNGCKRLTGNTDTGNEKNTGTPTGFSLIIDEERAE